MSNCPCQTNTLEVLRRLYHLAGSNNAAVIDDKGNDQAEAVEATPRLGSILDAVLDGIPASASECSDADLPSRGSPIPLMTAEQLPRGLFSPAKYLPGTICPC